VTATRLWPSLFAAVMLFAGVAAVQYTLSTDDVGEATVSIRGADVAPQPRWVEGTPVWVVQARGGVHVFEALNPHPWYGLRELVGLCAPDGGYAEPVPTFVAAWDGSTFDQFGRWSGGPAPSSLHPFEVRSLEGDTAALTSALAAHARPSGATATGSVQCAVHGGEDSLPPAVFHTAQGSGRSEFSGFVVSDGREVALCKSVTGGASGECDGPAWPIAGASPRGQKGEFEATVLARRQAGVLYDAILMP
jgi:hypothetical protein